MQDLNTNLPKKKNCNTFVRFTEEQYAEIQNDSEHIGESIPTLLKNSYFNKRKTSILMSKKDAQSMLSALNKIGNNINQIARRTNSGCNQDWHSAFKEYADAIATIATHITGFGRGKN